MKKQELINELMEFVKSKRTYVYVSPLTLHASQQEHKTIGNDLLYGDLNHIEVNEQHGKGEYLVVCNGSGYERNFRDMKSLSKHTLQNIYNEVMKGQK